MAKLHVEEDNPLEKMREQYEAQIQALKDKYTEDKEKYLNAVRESLLEKADIWKREGELHAEKDFKTQMDSFVSEQRIAMASLAASFQAEVDRINAANAEVLADLHRKSLEEQQRLQELEELVSRQQAALEIGQEKTKVILEQQRFELVNTFLSTYNFPALTAPKPGGKTILESALEDDIASREASSDGLLNLSNVHQFIEKLADYYAANNLAPDLKIVELLSYYVTEEEDINLLVYKFAKPENQEQLPKLREKFLNTHNTKEDKDKLTDQYVVGVMLYMKRLNVGFHEALYYFIRAKEIAAKYNWPAAFFSTAYGLQPYIDSKEVEAVLSGPEVIVNITDTGIQEPQYIDNIGEDKDTTYGQEGGIIIRSNDSVRAALLNAAAKGAFDDEVVVVRHSSNMISSLTADMRDTMPLPGVFRMATPPPGLREEDQRDNVGNTNIIPSENANSFSPHMPNVARVLSEDRVSIDGIQRA